ncbi:MAG: hypothetical protein ABF330_00590, partial [Lentimonas sp.]
GIPDSVEQLHNLILDSDDPVDAVLDKDGDEFSNSQEILPGTDLANASSFFQVVASNDSDFSVEISNFVERRVYALEYSLNLVDVWKAIDAVFTENPHDGLSYKFHVSTSENKGFLRVRAIYSP